MAYFVKLPDPPSGPENGAERYVDVLNGMSTIGQRQLRRTGFGGYEVHTAATVCALLERWEKNASSPAVFFDVGANLGHYTLLVKGLWRDTTAVAFEPTPATHLWQRRVMYANGFEVRSEALAVGDSEREVTLYLSNKSDSSNSLNPEFRRHKGEVRVQCVTLDGYCDRNGLQPDLLKIDTETLEVATIRGSLGMIRTKRPAIVIEILNRGDDPGPELTEIFDELGGYHYYRITDAHGLAPSKQIFGAPDESFLNWLLVPEALDDAFFDSVAAWREQLAWCTPDTTIAPRRAGLVDRGKALLAEDHRARGLAMLERAVKHGDVAAHYHLGRSYEDAKRYEEAASQYRAGAAAGERSARRGLARAHRLGRGVPVDLAEAKRLLEEGAEQGDGRAAMELATILAETDPGAALAHYARAAELGIKQAHYHLARHFEDAKNYAKSVEHHRRGAEAGEVACIRGMARAYRLGRGVAKDETEATRWEAKLPAAT